MHWRSSAAAACMTVLAASAWAGSSIPELAKQCDEGRGKSCRELAKTAESGKDTRLRMQAIWRLKDTAILTRISQHDVYPAVRDAAVSRLKVLQGGSAPPGGTAAAPVAAAGSAPPAGAQTAAANDAAGILIEVPEGTRIQVKLDEQLSSDAAHVGQAVLLSAVEETKVGDVVVIQKGAKVQGTVVTAVPKRRAGRAGKLDFSIDKIATVDGTFLPLRYAMTETKGGGHSIRSGVIAAGVSVVFWPAAPVALLMKGKDITLDRGITFDVYTDTKYELNRAVEYALSTTAAPTLRLRAAALVSGDQALADVAVRANNPQVSATALDRIQNEEVLSSLAGNGSAPMALRLRAVGRIHGPALARLVELQTDAGLVEAAMKGISDPAVLTTIAKESKQEATALLAVRQLTAQPDLADVAKNAKKPAAASAAAARLTDPALLHDVIQTSPIPAARLAAVRRVSDEVHLVELARSDPDEAVAAEAAGKIKSQSLLAEIARTAKNPGARSAAVSKLTDTASLAQIARTAGDARIRRLAIERLTDPDELARSAKADPDGGVRVAAASRISDQPALTQLARTAPDPRVRQAALQRISSAALLPLVQKEKDPAVRKAAVAFLSTDSARLQLARTDKDPGVRADAISAVQGEALLAPLAKGSMDGEALLWLRAETANQAASYREYLKYAPAGKHASEARVRAGTVDLVHEATEALKSGDRDRAILRLEAAYKTNPDETTRNLLAAARDCSVADGTLSAEEKLKAAEILQKGAAGNVNEALAALNEWLGGDRTRLDRARGAVRRSLTALAQSRTITGAYPENWEQTLGELKGLLSAPGERPIDLAAIGEIRVWLTQTYFGRVAKASREIVGDKIEADRLAANLEKEQDGLAAGLVAGAMAALNGKSNACGRQFYWGQLQRALGGSTPPLHGSLAQNAILGAQLRAADARETIGDVKRAAMPVLQVFDQGAPPDESARVLRETLLLPEVERSPDKWSGALTCTNPAASRFTCQGESVLTVDATQLSNAMMNSNFDAMNRLQEKMRQPVKLYQTGFVHTLGDSVVLPFDMRLGQGEKPSGYYEISASIDEGGKVRQKAAVSGTVPTGIATLRVVADPSAPLQFQVTEFGYRYVSGRGSVTIDDGPPIDFGGFSRKAAAAKPGESDATPIVPAGALVREGVITRSYSRMTDGAWVPAFEIDRFPGVTFLCTPARAAQWKIVSQFSDGASTVTIGEGGPVNRRVRVTTRKAGENLESVIDLQDLPQGQ